MTHNSHLVYRPDIDGLRAVAVLLVIIFHGFPNFIKGGFIGVDIFFVISGYLITRIIFKAQQQGNFNVIQFYSRRIKRIFPSLLVVLIACLIGGWYVLLSDEYQLLGKHSAAGTLYISNFVLQSEAGYFDASAETKPLLHLWSLAIEEQFYLCFPLLLILSLRINKNPIFIIFLGIIISFFLNIILIDQYPTEVFFYPQTRSWELLIGSLVAYVDRYNRHCFDKLSVQLPFFKSPTNSHHTANLLSWFGLLLIVFSWFNLDKRNITFPGVWALCPTLGAAGLILAGESAWFNRNILAKKPAVFIGIISYPLYLWHWPLLVFMQTVEMEKPKPTWRILALLLSILLAWLTYYLVEKRLRFHSSRMVSVGLLMSLIGVGCLGYFIDLRNGFQNRFEYINNWNTGELKNTAWNKNWGRQEACIEKFGNTFDFCLIQHANLPVTVMLIGDSHANHLYPALLKHTLLQNDNILNLGDGSCPPFFNTHEEKCHESINIALEKAILTPSVHTVILSFSDADTFNTARPFLVNTILRQFFLTAPPKNESLHDLMRKTLHRLLQANKRVIFIMDTPILNFNPTACAKRPWKISQQHEKFPCAMPLISWQTTHQNHRNTLRALLHEFPTVEVLDVTEAFCDKQNCWAVKNQKLLYRDFEHLNETGALYLGDFLNSHYPFLLGH